MLKSHRVCILSSQKKDVDLTETAEMFESICIRNQNESTEPIDIGFLAEAMLFYQQVRVVGNQLVLRQLIKQCGPDTFLELIKSGLLKFSFQDNNTGIQTLNSNSANEVHSPMLFSVPAHALSNIAPELFIEATGRSGRGRRLANRLVSLAEIISYPESITKAVGEDFTSTAYIKKAVGEILKASAPEYEIPQSFEFEVEKTTKGFSVKTSLDFKLINESYHKRVPVSHSSISPAFLLARLFAVQENLYISSKYAAELAVGSGDSRLLQIKVDNILNTRNASGEQIARFQDFLLDDAHAIREAINAGEKSLADMLRLLEKAAKFKEWLKNQKPDENLCKTFFKEATSSTWIDKLPAKTIRWSLFTGTGVAADAAGAGGIGTVVGIALSAADTFVLDKIIKGWNPNHFISEHLMDFLR